MSPLMKRMLAAKEARRKELAALPFAEKLVILEKLRDRSLMLASHPLRDPEKRRRILAEKSKSEKGK